MGVAPYAATIFALSGETVAKTSAPKARGDLDGDVADASDAGVDEGFLAVTHAGAVDQALPCGDHAQRQDRSLAHREILRFVREQVGVGGDPFGESTLVAADSAYHPVDLVAGPEGGDAGADLLHSSCHVDAEDGGQGLLRMSCFSGADLDVERVHTAGGDPDQNLSWTEDWVGGVPFEKRSVGRFDQPGFVSHHVLLQLSFSLAEDLPPYMCKGATGRQLLEAAKSNTKRRPSREMRTA